jgi:hypothetical protein
VKPPAVHLGRGMPSADDGGSGGPARGSLAQRGRGLIVGENGAVSDTERLVTRILALLDDPALPQKVAEAQAARIDPWRWYCRRCGAKGQDASRPVRNEQAARHLGETECGRGRYHEEAESGRLLHVWTWGQ